MKLKRFIVRKNRVWAATFYADRVDQHGNFYIGDQITGSYDIANYTADDSGGRMEKAA